VQVNPAKCFTTRDLLSIVSSPTLWLKVATSLWMCVFFTRCGLPFRLTRRLRWRCPNEPLWATELFFIFKLITRFTNRDHGNGATYSGCCHNRVRDDQRCKLHSKRDSNGGTHAQANETPRALLCLVFVLLDTQSFLSDSPFQVEDFPFKFEQLVLALVCCVPECVHLRLG